MFPLLETLLGDSPNKSFKNDQSSKAKTKMNDALQLITAHSVYCKQYRGDTDSIQTWEKLMPAECEIPMLEVKVVTQQFTH